ncbi:MAG: transporter substrate-binding domain-containing protein [Oleiphilaceae bacterium]|nr:transporter substrate-binding domain-containing protein [Oleiphilaceae bacterium]
MRGLLGKLPRLAALCCLWSSVQASEPMHLNLVSFVDAPYVLPVEHRPHGLVVDYVEALMKRAGYSYNIEVLPPKRAVLHALTQENTCVFPIERSQEREVEFHWVSPVLISRHGFFHHPDKKFDNLRVLEDVRSLRLGSYLGSGLGEYLASMGFDVDYAAENSANIHKLLAGRIDLWASDEISAHFIASLDGRQLPPSPLVFFTTVRAMGCQRDMPVGIIQNLTDTLRAMYRDGSFEKIKQAFAKRMGIALP